MLSSIMGSQMLIFLACDATKHTIEYGQDESLGSRSTTGRKCTVTGQAIHPLEAFASQWIMKAWDI